MLTTTVELFLDKYKLLEPKNNIIVAFSGGYDSMCLLDIMKKLAPKYNLKLIAAHLNHNWRGQESDQEEDNCRKYCKDIIYYSEKLPGIIPHTETAAREARYDFLSKCARKFNSKIVLTAHNANDNAETVFYRITRGTGIKGLEGIAEQRDIYYRPLLKVYRNEIEDYCKEQKLNPNKDSSNFDTSFMRNKIRHEIFPKIRESVPDFEVRLNELSENASNTNRIIEKEIKQLTEYSTDEFCDKDYTMQSAIIHKFLRDNKLDYDKKKINEIQQFIQTNRNSKSGKTHSLNKDKWIFVNSKIIELIKKSSIKTTELAINTEGTYRYEDKLFTIKSTETKPAQYPNDNSNTAYVEIEDINLTLRHRTNGDTIVPLGMQGKQKLKKYLNSKKIPNHKKDELIFLCKGSEVLWAPGIGMSNKIRVTNKPTHILKIEERQECK